MFSKSGILRTSTRAWRRHIRTTIPDRLFRTGAHLKRRLLKAEIIAVTGSAGKSTTTRLLRHVLAGTRITDGLDVYNTMPDVSRKLAYMPLLTEMAIFETGASKPGDLSRLARLLKPHAVIVTLVALEHRSTFRTLDGIAKEKANLVASLPVTGLAVLNADDPHVMGMATRTKARIITFGRSQDADYQILDADYHFPAPLSVTVRCAKGRFRIKSKLAGLHFAPDIAAAFAAAVEFGVPPDQAAERIADVTPVANRCEIVTADNGTVFIKDAVKGAFHSFPAAFQVLAAAKAPQKRVVIGHISDYSGHSKRAYARIYAMAAEIADEVIFTGENAHKSNAPPGHRESGRFLAIDDIVAVADHIRTTAIPGEVILVKGASAWHLERAALAMTETVQCWENRCGYSIGCHECGMYMYPFEEHSQRRRIAKKAGNPIRRILSMLTKGTAPE